MFHRESLYSTHCKEHICTTSTCATCNSIFHIPNLSLLIEEWKSSKLAILHFISQISNIGFALRLVGHVLFHYLDLAVSIRLQRIFFPSHLFYHGDIVILQLSSFSAGWCYRPATNPPNCWTCADQLCPDFSSSLPRLAFRWCSQTFCPSPFFAHFPRAGWNLGCRLHCSVEEMLVHVLTSNNVRLLHTASHLPPL